jgi:hypothetical protein
MTAMALWICRASIVVCGAYVAAPTAAVSQSLGVVASSVSYRSRLLGVYEAATGNAIDGARVVDMVNHVTALTTATGTVSLSFLSEGANLVRIERVGFQPMTMSVQISPSDTVPLTVLLQTLAHDLPAVLTRDSAPQYSTPALRRFEERRLSPATHGYFIAEAELQRHPMSRMSEIVRRLPGLSVVCPARGNKCWANATRVVGSGGKIGGSANPDRCPVAVYIDGVPSTDNDLTQLAVNEFAGVEFYPGGASVPPQYNLTALTCGVLLFWSRER